MIESTCHANIPPIKASVEADEPEEPQPSTLYTPSTPQKRSGKHFSMATK